MCVVASLVAKITFVVAEITLKVVVITFSVVKITFAVAEITFQVVLITSTVAKITFVVAEMTFRMVVSTSSVVTIKHFLHHFLAAILDSVVNFTLQYLQILKQALKCKIRY